MILTAPAPAQPIEKQDLSNTYYYMHNYPNVIDMLNTNLLVAMNSLTKLFAVGSSDRVNAMQNYQPPFFEIDPDTYKIALNIDARFITSINTTAGDSFGHTFASEIFLNNRLYELLYGLP